MYKLLVSLLALSMMAGAQVGGSPGVTGGNGSGSVPQLMVVGTGGGNINLTQGAAHTAPVNGFGLQAPTSIPTGYIWTAPSADCNGLLSITADVMTCAASGGSAFNAITSGTNTAAAMVEGSGSSLVPSGTGQISDIESWWSSAPGALVPAQPTLTAANTGGSLTQGNYLVKLTYVGPSTIVPSGETKLSLTATNCASNSTCQLTVTMPTSCTAGNLPSGVTGCTVWDSATSGTEKQQAAANACVNITTATCLINTLAAGSTLVTPATTGILPPNFVATSLPDNIIPLLFITKGDGNTYPIAGMDMSALNFIGGLIAGEQPPAAGIQAGTFTWTDRFFVSDKSTPPPISNTLVSIDHESGQTTGTATIAGTALADDRALSVRMDNNLTTNPYYEQYLGMYLESFNDNSTFTCNPVGFGGATGETCHGGIRVNASDYRPSGAGLPNTIEALTGEAFAPQVSATALQQGTSNPAIIGVKGGAIQITSSVNGAGNIWAGGFFGTSAAVGNTNSKGVGVFISGPVSTPFATSNIGLYIDTNISASNAANFPIDSHSPARSRLLGGLAIGGSTVGNIVADAGTLGVTGSTAVTGSVSTVQMTTPTSIQFSHGGSAGGTTNTYVLCGKDLAGGSVCSAGTNDNAANANLTGTNFTNVNFAPYAAPSTNIFTTVDVYRTVSASQCNGGACTNGKIGTFTPGTDAISGAANITAVSDTGLVGDGSTPPAANTTGGSNVLGMVRSPNVCRITADVSLTVNTANSFCTFNVPPVAQAWAFECKILWAITAGTGTNNFAVGVNSSATPTGTTNAIASVVTATAGTNTNGSAAISASGATNILTGATYTPAATVLPATISGTVLTPAAGGTFAITGAANGTTATAAVKAGTQCQLL